MLFVGSAENRPLTSEEMAELMRGVCKEEIDELVSGLNESYRTSRSPFEIILEKDGYRLVLSKEFEFCRKRFYREEKAATLSQSVVDVLSLVAYLQPVTKKELEAKRMKPSGSILGQLVRRRLIQVERKKNDGQRVQTFYRTTDRFLDLFGLNALEELPKSQSFEMPDFEVP
jgi:segregation and condensation protein B